MLDQFDEVFGPHPPHILVTFYPLLRFYGSLDNSENFKKLIDDVCSLVELNPVPWEGVNLNRDEIRSRCRKNTLLEIFIQINELACHQLSKKIWTCKSMESLYLLDKYREEGFEPLYLYLYRDGRDVALSFKKAIVGEKHIYNLALKWKADQEACLKELTTMDKKKYIKIKYEYFVTNPENTIKAICNRTGLTYKNVIDDFYKSDESKRTAAGGRMWENVAKPIIKDNYGKFLKELSREEILIFEKVAGETLLKLGYPLHILSSYDDRSFSEQEISGFLFENQFLKKQIIEQLPKEDIEKRQRQTALIDSIKTYT